MISRRITAGVLTAGSAAIAVAVAVPAVASPSTAVYITAGSQPAGTAINFTAVSTNQFTIQDLRSSVQFKCPVGGVTLKGTLTTGTARPRLSTASITSTTFSSSCALSGIAVNVAGTGFPWNLNAPNTSVSSTTPPSSGQTTIGTIGNFSSPGGAGGVLANVNFGSASTCTFVFGNGSGGTGTIDNTGTVGGAAALGLKYTNGNPSTINVNTTDVATSAKLGINSTSAGATGCASGTIKPGDAARIFGMSSSGTSTDATFSVTATTSGGAAANPLWVTAY